MHFTCCSQGKRRGGEIYIKLCNIALLGSEARLVNSVNNKRQGPSFNAAVVLKIYVCGPDLQHRSRHSAPVSTNKGHANSYNYCIVLIEN